MNYTGIISSTSKNKAELRQIIRDIVEICNKGVSESNQNTPPNEIEMYASQTDIQRKIEETVTNGVGFNSRRDSINLGHKLNYIEIFYQ